MSEQEYVTCPECGGKWLLTGDGGGLDGAGNYHDPGCPHCDGQGVVPKDQVPATTVEHPTDPLCVERAKLIAVYIVRDRWENLGPTSKNLCLRAAFVALTGRQPERAWVHSVPFATYSEALS